MKDYWRKCVHKMLVKLTTDSKTMIHPWQWFWFLISWHQMKYVKLSTGGPRYSRTFYLQICLFTIEKWPKMTLLQSKWTFYLRIQDLRSKMTERIYLESRIKRETCTHMKSSSGVRQMKYIKLSTHMKSSYEVRHMKYVIWSTSCEVRHVRHS